MTYLVVSHSHGTIPLVVLRAGTVRAVHRDLVVVGSQTMAMGVIVGKETTLKHLIWGRLNAWHKVGRGEGQLLHLQWTSAWKMLLYSIGRYCNITTSYARN